MGQREWGYIHDTTSLGEHQLACCLEEMDGWDQSWMGLNLIVIMWWTVRLALVPGKDADTVRLSVCVWTLLSDFSGTPSAFSWVIFAEDVLLTSLLCSCHVPRHLSPTTHTSPVRRHWPYWPTLVTTNHSTTYSLSVFVRGFGRASTKSVMLPATATEVSLHCMFDCINPWLTHPRFGSDQGRARAEKLATCRCRRTTETKLTAS